MMAVVAPAPTMGLDGGDVLAGHRPARRDRPLAHMASHLRVIGWIGIALAPLIARGRPASATPDGIGWAANPAASGVFVVRLLRQVHPNSNRRADADLPHANGTAHVGAARQVSLSPAMVSRFHRLAPFRAPAARRLFPAPGASGRLTYRRAPPRYPVASMFGACQVVGCVSGTPSPEVPGQTGTHAGGRP